jgi:hypothetical protein
VCAAVHLRRPELARNAKFRVNLQASDGLARDPNAMARLEPLRSKYWPKIGIALAQYLHDLLLESARQAIVAGPITRPRYQSDGTLCSITPHQPSNLTARDPETLRSNAWIEISIDYRLYALESVQLAMLIVTLASCRIGDLRSPHGPGETAA